MEVLQQGFVSNMFASRFPTPTYTEWLMKASERSSYRRYADVLRLIGLADPDKRWLLKNPGHTWHPDLLFEVFPDALGRSDSSRSCGRDSFPLQRAQHAARGNGGT